MAQKGKINRQSLYESVTNKIIAELEQGRVPWVKPWGTDKINASIGLPKNAKSHRGYSGINILILWGAAITGGHSCQNWLTFKQAIDLGGNVRKGEKGTTVCYADRFTPKAEIERAKRDGDQPGTVPFLKSFTVFNVDQCDGLPESAYAGSIPLPEREIIPNAEQLIKATGADIRPGTKRAFYQPAGDYIEMPPQPAFHDQINYYRTAFHELGHWTGHKSRLGRDMSGSFGCKKYAHEELVAEMSAAFVCAELSIEPTVRHADYIGSWLEVLKNDNRAIFKAASHASKASEYILAYRESEQLAKAA